METADVVLMGDDLHKVVYILDTARKSRRIVAQNLTFSTLVVSVLAIGALAGALALPVAVVGHELSELLIIGNGLRMLRS